MTTNATKPDPAIREDALRQLECALAFQLAAAEFEQAGRADLAKRTRDECYRPCVEGNVALSRLVESAIEMKMTADLLDWVEYFFRYKRPKDKGDEQRLPLLAFLTEVEQRWSAAYCARGWLRFATGLRAWRRLRADVLPSTDADDQQVSSIKEVTSRLVQFFNAEASARRTRLGSPVGVGNSYRMAGEFSSSLTYLLEVLQGNGWGALLELHGALQRVDARANRDAWMSWAPVAGAEFLDALDQVPPGLTKRFDELVETQTTDDEPATKSARFAFAASLLRAAEDTLGRLSRTTAAAFCELLRRLFGDTQATLIASRPLTADDVENRVKPGISEPILERCGLRVDRRDGVKPFLLRARYAVPPPQPQLVQVLGRVVRLAQKTKRPELAQDAGTLRAAIETSATVTLREWWDRQHQGDAEKQLVSVNLIHAVVLAVTAAAHAHPKWNELADMVVHAIAEDGTFVWQLRDCDGTKQPFDAGFVCWERSVDHPVELRPHAGGGVPVLSVAGFGPIAPVSAILVPASWHDADGLPAFLKGQRARLDWLRRRDPDFDGWNEFDQALRQISLAPRNPDAKESRLAARMMFLALHPRAVPARYGVESPAPVPPAEYAGLLRTLLQKANPVGLPVDPATLDIVALTEMPSDEWTVEWDLGSSRPFGSVERILKQSGVRIFRVALGPEQNKLQKITRNILKRPPLCSLDMESAQAQALVQWDKMRIELPWMPTEKAGLEQFVSRSKALREWVKKKDGQQWLNTLARRAREDSSGMAANWFRGLTRTINSPPPLPLFPALERGRVVLIDLENMPAGVELVRSELPPGQLVGEEVTFSTDPAAVRGHFSIGKPAEGSTYCAVERLHELAGELPESESLQRLTALLLRQAAESVLRSALAPFNPGHDLLAAILEQLASRSRLEKPPSTLGRFHLALVALAQQAGYEVQPREWPYPGGLSLEQFRKAYPNAVLRYRYSPSRQAGQIQIDRFGLGPEKPQIFTAALAVGLAPAGVSEFEELMRQVAGIDDRRVLEYLESDEWFNGVHNRSHLRIKTALLFERFWATLGGAFRSGRSGDFDRLYNALKVVLRDPDVRLTPFQESPGPLEKELGWYEYEAQPRMTVSQSSEVQAVVQPGLVGSEGRRELNAIVRFKTG